MAKTVMFRMAREYGLEKDLNTILNYKEILEFKDYWDKYQRNEIAAAVIDRISDTTFRGGFEITQGEDEDETEFEKAWKALYKEHDLQDVFERADVLTPDRKVRWDPVRIFRCHGPQCLPTSRSGKKGGTAVHQGTVRSVHGNSQAGQVTQFPTLQPSRNVQGEDSGGGIHYPKDLPGKHGVYRT